MPFGGAPNTPALPTVRNFVNKPDRGDTGLGSVSFSTVRAPVFTPTNFTPPHQVDFQFPNIALAPTLFVFRSPLVSRQAPVQPPVDFQFRNIAVIPPAANPITNQTLDRPPPQSRQLDFQFPNIALVPTQFVFRSPLISRQAPIQPPVDFQFRNIAVIPSAANPITNQTFDRPPSLARQLDFQFPNVALQAFAQLAVHPVGAEIDESVPAVFPRQLDFLFPNLAAQLNALPVGKTLDETIPAPQARQLDFQFRNVALEYFAQLQVNPLGPRPDFAAPISQRRHVELFAPNLLVIQPTAAAPVTVRIFEQPAPQLRLLDSQFPNIAVQTPVVASAARSPVFTVQPQSVRQPDFQFPNLLTTALAVTYSPITQFWGPWPQPKRPPQDLLPPNLVIQTAAAPAFVFRAPLTSRPAPIVPPADFPFPNITLGVTYYPAGALWQTLPPPTVRVDFQFPNVAIRPATVFGKPIIPQAFGDHPPAPQRSEEFLGPNLTLAQTAPISGVVFRSPVFSRPIATQIRIDGPIPNLLTTTLSVAPVKPPAPNFFLFAILPAPQAAKWDPAPINLLTTTLFVPPAVSTDLHAKPFFATPGKLMSLP